MPFCFKLLRPWMRLALTLAMARAGKSIAARMAMMAITTRSSINVNPSLEAGAQDSFLRERTIHEPDRLQSRIKINAVRGIGLGHSFGVAVAERRVAFFVMPHGQKVVDNTAGGQRLPATALRNPR